jgi:hypothetical protein
MSVRVRVVVRKSVVDVTPELLRDAIASKLEAIAAQFPVREDEPARHVLVRLRVEREDNHPFGVWRLFATSDERRPVRIERLVGGSVFSEQRREMFDEIAQREENEVQAVRDVLHAAKECVVFEVDPGDASTMAWPTTLAAAASIALAGGGLVRVDDDGWWAPKGKELARVLNEA